MAAGIAEKGASVGEVERKKSKQSAKGQQGDNRDQVLAVSGCDHCKAPRANRSKAGAKAIHIVHEIEGVNNGKDPKDGDCVMKDRVWDEQGDPQSTGRDREGNQELSHEFYSGLQFVFI